MFFPVDVYAHSQTLVYLNGEPKPVTIKHIILRELDGPISRIPLDSPGLIDLLDQPLEKEAETLITRIMHILTGIAHL